MAVGILLGDHPWQSGFRAGGTGGEIDAGPGADPFAGAQEGPPAAGFGGFEEEDFNLPPSVELVTPEACRNDSRIVENQQIAGSKQGGKVGDGSELGLAGGAVEDEQAGGRSGWIWMLRDEIFGQ
jgi:hypothetical protein